MKQLKQLALIWFLAATPVTVAGSPEGLDFAHSRYNYKDHILYAGRPSNTYPELVRVHPDGSCEFRLYQPGGDNNVGDYFHVTVSSPNQIPEGTSDYYGFVLECNFSKQSAKVREFDMSSPKVK